MRTVQNSSVSLPVQSRWGLSTDVAGRPVVRGVLTIDEVSGNTIRGTANFRGTPLVIQGYWDENTKQLRFETPYASFSGYLQMYDDVKINTRHYVLSGQLVMKHTSIEFGRRGNWIATTNRVLTGPPIKTSGIPPVGAFLTSDLLMNTPRYFANYFW